MSFNFICIHVYWLWHSLDYSFPLVGAGLYMDSQAGLDFLLSRRDIDRKKIIVFGRSLGGAVAIYLAASHANRDK